MIVTSQLAVLHVHGNATSPQLPTEKHQQLLNEALMSTVVGDDPDTPVPEFGCGRPHLSILIHQQRSTARPYGSATPCLVECRDSHPKLFSSGSRALVRDVHADLVEIPPRKLVFSVSDPEDICDTPFD